MKKSMAIISCTTMAVGGLIFAGRGKKSENRGPCVQWRYHAI